MGKTTLNMLIKWVKMDKKYIQITKKIRVFQLAHSNLEMLRSHLNFALSHNGETGTFRNSALSLINSLNN